MANKKLGRALLFFLELFPEPLPFSIGGTDACAWPDLGNALCSMAVRLAHLNPRSGHFSCRAILAQSLCLSLVSTCLMVVHLSVVAWPLCEYPAGTIGTTRAAWKEWTPPPLPFFLLRQCAVSSYAGSLPLPSSVQACFLTFTLSDVLAHLLAIVRVDHGGQTVIGMPHMTNRPVDMHHSPEMNVRVDHAATPSSVCRTSPTGS